MKQLCSSCINYTQQFKKRLFFSFIDTHRQKELLIICWVLLHNNISSFYAKTL